MNCNRHHSEDLAFQCHIRRGLPTFWEYYISTDRHFFFKQIITFSLFSFIYNNETNCPTFLLTNLVRIISLSIKDDHLSVCAITITPHNILLTNYPVNRKRMPSCSFATCVYFRCKPLLNTDCLQFMRDSPMVPYSSLFAFEIVQTYIFIALVWKEISSETFRWKIRTNWDASREETCFSPHIKEVWLP